MSERPDIADIAVNLAGFQAAWLALALGAANGVVVLGLFVALGVFTIHLSRSIKPRQEVKLMTLALLLGVVIESVLMAGGFIAFHGQGWVDGPIGPIAPVWLLALWPLFATLINVTFRAVRNKVLLAVLFAAFVVPVAYYAGDRLRALIISAPVLMSMAMIGLAWAFALPLLFRASVRWDGWREI